MAAAGGEEALPVAPADMSDSLRLLEDAIDHYRHRHEACLAQSAGGEADPSAITVNVHPDVQVQLNREDESTVRLANGTVIQHRYACLDRRVSFPTVLLLLSLYRIDCSSRIVNLASTRQSLSHRSLPSSFNGTKIVSLPDGTVVEILLDGTRYIRNARTGTILTETADGAQSVSNPAQTPLHKPEKRVGFGSLAPLLEKQQMYASTTNNAEHTGTAQSPALDSTTNASASPSPSPSKGTTASASAMDRSAVEEPDEDQDASLDEPDSEDDVDSSSDEEEIDRKPSLPDAASAASVVEHDNVIHQGWLFKSNGLLVYFPDAPQASGRNSTPINAIDVVGAEVTQSTSSKRPHGFIVASDQSAKRRSSATNKREYGLAAHCLVQNYKAGTALTNGLPLITTSSRKYVLAGSSDADRDAWMARIRYCAALDSQSLDGTILPVAQHSLASRFTNFARGINASNKVRQLVSKQKIRFQKDGFDLDLTYITPNIVAMGYPAEGTEAVYRNRYEDTLRFLEERHPGAYRVYNLCSERAYPPSRFHNRVGVYPFDDHNPAPLPLVLACCADIHAWLAANPERNVAAIHCKAGKGRTGLIISCYLMYAGICPDPDSAMTMFGAKRTHNGKGVTIPSQRRYIRYFHTMLQGDRTVPPATPLTLTGIRLHGVPNYDFSGGCQPYYQVYQEGVLIFSSKPAELRQLQAYKRQTHRDIRFSCNMAIEGNIRIELWDCDRGFHSEEKMFAATFFTGMVEGTSLRMVRQELDGAHKKKHLKMFEPQFAMELTFKS
ncbi:uncharacterized protein MONBRDRAFT_10809 [Monosiga brevicollis MX1]|uniref:Phosphatidylinositol-3,4,5-trisphosphate 3-phosphatase n=1 Tax=Monosiga brevicollis TaxID=81824 RepID=A9V7A8_MONBE|nr:uncharacterized protein MONBRDRAFT_10809 [Monosiga brevicollis MX1]EDQ86484.1 predicted protein [Monosiga brevicollis MX1]|eukprot:XP_001748597.1 hypothetical protein [Monosiga brevicollis MX1]